jgi:asparagine synthase (glutamine-hydrolysing)
VCGIAGIIATDGAGPVDTTPMARMLSCLRHRGPDDEGVHVESAAVLGHRRLSIIDVASGHQPLRGSRASTIVVVNGEIYNYRELAAELADGGAVFRTKSDSEVVAHAFDRWGAACLDRLDGMFALAVWDGAERRLLLARDRMGEKPLFYCVRAGLLLFASELTALLAHPAVEANIDACALREYLTLEYVPAPRSLIRGVHKLEPGTCLTLAGGAIALNRYWAPVPRPAAEPLPYRQAVAGLRQRLEQAVTSRLMSDVPLGVFLSGGIDSSTVAALAARHGPIDTFSIGFQDPSFDESSYAALVARHIGSRHHERRLEAHEMPDLVPRLGSLLDEPIGDASIVPTALLSRFAREHVTVALGGDGGDELFGGYPMHQAERVARVMHRLPRPVLAAAATAADRLPVAHGNFSFGFRARTFLHGLTSAPQRQHATWMSSFEPDAHDALLVPELAAAARECNPFRAFDEVWDQSAGAPPLARACHLDARLYLPNDVLVKVDRASMSVGLEVRAPLLAAAVVEFAFALPDAYRMRRLTGKRILRDAVRDLLPAEILRRPKKGFGIPVAAWIAEPLRELVHDTLRSRSAAEFFRPAAVEKLLSEHERRVRDHRKPIWTLLALLLWRDSITAKSP